MSICALLAFSAQAQEKSKKDKKSSTPTTQAVTLGQPVVKAALPVLKTAQDSASYAYGIILGNSLKRQMANNDLDRKLVTDAIMATIKDDSLLFTAENASTIHNGYQKKASMKANEVNLKQGEEFLAKNKTRQGVTTTPSGLQYEVMKKADNPGAKPTAADKVRVHYHGTLVDGQVFDSSVQRGQPAEFPLGGVIKGWTEGLQYMNVGDKFKFFLPYQLAYGERGASAKIKPYSALIFEVELLEILK